jgi:hypothetical protein
MVLRGWLFTDLIAPRRCLAALHARSFRFWPALSCRASRQYFCSDRARRVAARLWLLLSNVSNLPDAPSEQRRLPYMLLLTTAVLRAAEYLLLGDEAVGQLKSSDPAR